MISFNKIKNNYRFLKIWVFNFILFFLLYMIFPATLSATEQYEKKDIVVLGISSSSQLNDIEYFYRIQSYVYKAFVELKRFNVIYYPDINIPVNKTSELIDDIKKYRTQNLNSNKDTETNHLFGNLVFKKEEFDKIVNSFYLIIPQVNDYNEITETKDDGSSVYKVSFEISIEIVDLKNNNILKEIIINQEDESDNSISEAQSNCLNNFMIALQYNLKDIEEFKLKSGVLKVEKDNVFIYLGASLGVKINDEFLIFKKIKFKNSFIKKQTGLIRIYAVSENISIGKILIEREKIEEGDTVVEKNRIPINLFVYGGYKFLNFDHVWVNDYSTDINILNTNSTIFTNLSLQYFLNFNMFIELGVEVYITSPISYSYFGGLGYSFIYRRLSVSGFVAGQLFQIKSDLFAENNYYYGETFGGRAEIRIEYLLNPDSKLIFGGNFIFSGNINEINYVDFDNSKYNIPILNENINFSGAGFYLAYVFRF